MKDTLALAMELLKLLPAVIAGVRGAAEAMMTGKKQIEAMVAAGRDPTPEEWDAVHARTQALLTDINTD